ncbi:MAG: hypothetical protein ACTSRS_07950 [Candidatus Helarchaeota archaeon]
MSSKISWFEPNLRGLLVLLIAFAAVTQLITIFLAAFYFPINSAYILTFVSLGIVSLLFGVEILFAELIYKYRLHRRQLKPFKKRKKLKRISEIRSIFIGAGIAIGLFILLYFLFSYFLIDPFTLPTLPIYGKFCLAEALSGITLIILLLVFESTMPFSSKE